MLRPDFVRAAMGIPQFSPAQIPLAPGVANIFDYTLRVGNHEITNISTLSTGSTHTVVFVDEAPDETAFQTLSPLIENHALFPERTSIMWAVPDGANRFQIRIWERGVGETLACGTEPALSRSPRK
jgi:diaminopimelate epimerase